MQSFLTANQAASITGKHPETIRRWCRVGKLKSKKIGHEFLIPLSEFQPKETDTERNQKIIDYVFG